MENSPSNNGGTNDYAPLKEGAVVDATRQPRRRCGSLSRLTIILVGVAAAIVVIALAVGLGVGLTRGSGSSNSNSPTPSDTSAPIPSPTGNSTTNSTVWQPAVASTWQIVLQEAIELNSSATSITPDVDIFDIDLFNNANTTIAKLHTLGKRVVCYFSAGSYEPYRPDSSMFQSSDLGKALDGWPDEKWLNITSANVRKIMVARIQLASDKGCDAVDPDNVDGYNNDNGLGLTEADSINYMQWMSAQTGALGLGIGLKNAGEILTNVTSIVQFSVNEQCIQYSECETFAPMIEAGKPVFHIEYPSGTPGNVKTTKVNELCSTTGDAVGSSDFSTVIKDMDLDGWVQYCSLATANTSMVTSS